MCCLTTRCAGVQPSEQLAWSLLETIWPGSFNLQTQGERAEENYLVAGPFGDTWDVLAEPNFTKSLSMYRLSVD